MIQTSFINVDLELYSKKDLSTIADELGSNIFPLTNEYVGDVYNLAFECSLNENEPDTVIEQFIELLDVLSKKSRALLSSCDKKIFDIGYDSGNKGVVYHSLSSDLLSRIASLGFEVKVTVYPMETNDAQ